jgi:hypothetical protein
MIEKEALRAGKGDSRNMIDPSVRDTNAPALKRP